MVTLKELLDQRPEWKDLPVVVDDQHDGTYAWVMSPDGKGFGTAACWTAKDPESGDDVLVFGVA